MAEVVTYSLLRTCFIGLVVTYSSPIPPSATPLTHTFAMPTDLIEIFHNKRQISRNYVNYIFSFFLFISIFVRNACQRKSISLHKSISSG